MGLSGIHRCCDRAALQSGLDAAETFLVETVKKEREANVARMATPDQIRDGKYYKDFAEYQADRAA